MNMIRKTFNSNNQEVSVICVPWFPQQDKSYCCFPYSLWMVLQYYKNVYKNKLINDSIPNLSINEIVKLCKTNKYTGTRITDQLISELNNKISSLKFELKKESSYEQVKEVIDKKCLCIVLYDCNYIKNNIPSQVSHAGVVIALDDYAIYLNNPWLGAETEIDRVSFSDAWEIIYNEVLVIVPNLQSNLRAKFKENAN